jgi:hypothetical protein
MSLAAKVFLAIMGACALLAVLALAQESEPPVQPRLRLDIIEQKMQQLAPKVEDRTADEPLPPKVPRPKARPSKGPSLFKPIGPPSPTVPEEPTPEPPPPEAPLAPPARRGWTWEQIDYWREFKRLTTGD